VVCTSGGYHGDGRVVRLCLDTPDGLPAAGSSHEPLSTAEIQTGRKDKPEEGKGKGEFILFFLRAKIFQPPSVAHDVVAYFALG